MGNPLRPALGLAVPVIAWLGCLACLAGDPTPQVTVSVVVTTNYYTVTGSNLVALRASKAKARPWQGKSSFDAVTAWSVHWHYGFREEAGLVLLDSLEAKTRVVVTLPRWTPPTGTDPNLVEYWRAFLKGLGTHELGHVSFARLATAELQKQLARLGACQSEQQLSENVDKIGEQVVGAFRAKERDYDQQTEHGIKQGVRF
jgi:predicted secreted Zn-dependent protease